MLVALLALATATVTVTLARAKITKPIRDVLRRSSFINSMLECLYCTSHWVAMGLAVLGPPLGWHPVVDWLVTAAALVALSAPVMWIINRAHGTMQWGEH